MDRTWQPGAFTSDTGLVVARTSEDAVEIFAAVFPSDKKMAPREEAKGDKSLHYYTAGKVDFDDRGTPAWTWEGLRGLTDALDACREANAAARATGATL